MKKFKFGANIVRMRNEVRAYARAHERENSGRVAAAFVLFSFLASPLHIGELKTAKMDLGNGQIVLEEDYDENYEPTEKGKRTLLGFCK